MLIYLDSYLLNWKNLLCTGKHEITDDSEIADIVVTCYSNLEKFKNKTAILLINSKKDIENYKSHKDNHFKIDSIELYDKVDYLKIGNIELQPSYEGIYFKNDDDKLLAVIKGNKLYSNIIFSEIHRVYYTKSVKDIISLFLNKFEKNIKEKYPVFSDKEWRSIEVVINYNMELGSEYQKLTDFLRIASTDKNSLWLNYFVKEGIFEYDDKKINIRFVENAPKKLKKLAENWPELHKILGE